MPEGDTIHRAAARLRSVLVGQTVRAFRAARMVGDRPKVGTTIENVEAVGKHLLVHFDDGLTLQTHMRMTGSWHLYRHGERYRHIAIRIGATPGFDRDVHAEHEGIFLAAMARQEARAALALEAHIRLTCDILTRQADAAAGGGFKLA